MSSRLESSGKPFTRSSTTFFALAMVAPERILRPRHVLPRRLRQLPGPGPDLPLVRALQHDPQLGLGAAPADEHATVLAEGRRHRLRRFREMGHLLEGSTGGKS